MPGNIGWQGAIIILIVLLVIFGPKRLPSLGRQLGAGMREFKDSISRKADADSDADDDEDAGGAATRRDAAAALGRPEDEASPRSVSDGIVSEKQ